MRYDRLAKRHQEAKKVHEDKREVGIQTQPESEPLLSEARIKTLERKIEEADHKINKLNEVLEAS